MSHPGFKKARELVLETAEKRSPLLLDQPRPPGQPLQGAGGPVSPQCAERWQQWVIHVFDRGYAGAPWLSELSGHQLRFIIRWPTRYHLVDANGQRPVWQITRCKRSQDHRLTGPPSDRTTV